MTALAGLLLAALLWWGLKSFARADPAALALWPKRAGGVAALGLAAFLLLRGQLDVAIFVGGVGAWLLGWSAGWPSPRGWRGLAGQLVGRRQPSGRIVGLERAPAPGQVTARVRVGPAAGRDLADLGEGELWSLRGLCLRSDPEGGRLVEAELDRRFPGWREHAEADANGRARGFDVQRGPMSEEEAHQVLGLQPPAGQEAVRAAHRELIKKLHPDQGGSTYLASRVNQAKDVLLNRHR